MTNETRDKLKLIARDRLRNRPGEYRRFQASLQTIEGTRLLTLAGALPVVTRQAADFGIPRALEAERAHLLRIVDQWANAQPQQPAVEPLASPGAAMTLPPLGVDTGEPAPAKKPAPANKKWTPERKAELKAFRDAHTEKETAAKFGISGPRIRILLPTGEPQKKPYSVFTHHIK
ncbi:hypothetical protein [Rhodoferax sp.]|uniref:hypothetical protein n=1 Tax=Rhodoferax sp. TaxID=50421 RepID=UPI00260FEDDE|nr:hypothetical protein [Rhodoferax sp.]MDD5001779.1 hypothetical protein [Thiomonas arsenitoxydans]MDD5478488.1 hypothetical protein [Rhodoferax sp.]